MGAAAHMQGMTDALDHALAQRITELDTWFTTHDSPPAELVRLRGSDSAAERHAYRLAQWLARQRVAHRAGTLTVDRVAALNEACPGWFTPGRSHATTVTPALAAVTRASATRRAAPLAQFAAPRRSRVAAITGAETGVETTASNAFRPLTPEYPDPAPCLAYPYVALTVSSMSR